MYVNLCSLNRYMYTYGIFTHIVKHFVLVVERPNISTFETNIKNVLTIISFTHHCYMYRRSYSVFLTLLSVLNTTLAEGSPTPWLLTASTYTS